MRSSAWLCCLAVASTSCSGTDRIPARPAPARLLACPRAAIATPDRAIVFGVVVDEEHRPLAGATIAAIGWRHDGAAGGWTRANSPTTTSDRDGRYELATAPGAFALEVTHAGRASTGVGYTARLGSVRQLDIVIDTRLGGAAAVFDAGADDVTRITTCPWTCPLYHPPPREWWRRTRPCPDDATPVFDFDREHGHTAIRCQTRTGVQHGAFSEWRPATGGGLVMTSGWYTRGRECRSWREPADVAVTHRSPSI